MRKYSIYITSTSCPSFITTIPIFACFLVIIVDDMARLNITAGSVFIFCGDERGRMSINQIITGLFI